MKSISFLVVGFSFVYATQCTAYELSTHALMTNRAYERSVLGSSWSTFLRLGIERWVMNPGSASSPFGASHHEIVDNNGNLVNRVANVNFFETERIPGRPLKDKYLEVTGWLMRGAIREDDFPAAKLGPITLITAVAPQDAPDSHVTRVSNHFFDPVNNRALDTTPFLNAQVVENNGFAAVKAVDWATGDLDSFATNGLTVAEPNYRNHFSLRRAREAMWRALTLRYRDNAGQYQEIAPRTELWRKKYWATVFRSLGNAVHLIQDMAQPQHTRNEGHSGVGPYESQTGAGHGTVLENYLEARVNGQGTFTVDVGATDKTVRITPKPLVLDVAPTAYPIPKFNRYSDFWSTSTPTEPFSKRKGLADFSNREFFTPANMIGDTTFQSPSPNAADYTVFSDETPTNWDGTAFTGLAALAKVRVYTRTVSDALTGGTTTSPAFTRSIWDRFMELDNIPLRRNLNHVVFNAHADLLIPRAVAYSAGLIDYFFRGQLEIRLPEEGVYAILDHSKVVDNCKDLCGFKKIKLKVANSTPDIVVSGPSPNAIIQQTMSGGTLVAVAKYHKNTCYTTDLEGEYDSRSGKTLSEYLQLCRSLVEEITVSQPLANQSPVSCNANTPGDCDTKANASTTLTFNFSTPIPINATDLHLQVVYRGPLGSEQDAVVVATKDIAEPTYLSVVNVSDYLICYNNSWVFKDANGNLPASIPTMVDGKLATELYKATNYNFWRISFQPAQDTTLARVDTVQPKEYARVAVLTERGQSYNDEINGYVSPEPPPFKLVTAGLNQSGFTTTGSPTIGLFDYKASSFRKVKAHAPLYGYNYNTQGTTGICRGLAPPTTEPGYPPPTAIRSVTITFP